MFSCALAFLVLSRLALGAVTPIAPGPGEVFTAGSECSISWTPDESGKWKSFSIDLMTGSNSNMTLVTNVVEGLDGTDSSLSPYTWTCPDVDPYSAIYFYQFNPADDKSNPAWTTRFTIASSAGETTAPPQSKQPNGDDVPWGLGVMRSESTVASREKHHNKGSTEEDDSGESYDSDGDEEASQPSGKGKVKGGTYGDGSVDATTTGKNSRKGGNVGTEETYEDGDLEVTEEDKTVSKSPKSSLKDDEGGSRDNSDTADSNVGTEENDPSPKNTGGGSPTSTRSRMETIRSRPTSIPFSAGNINAAAASPTLSLPSTTPLSAQPVGCAGGTNATSSYCSAPSSVNHASYVSELDWRTVFAAVLFCLFKLL